MRYDRHAFEDRINEIFWDSIEDSIEQVFDDTEPSERIA